MRSTIKTVKTGSIRSINVGKKIWHGSGEHGYFAKTQKPGRLELLHSQARYSSIASARLTGRPCPRSLSTHAQPVQVPIVPYATFTELSRVVSLPMEEGSVFVCGCSRYGSKSSQDTPGLSDGFLPWDSPDPLSLKAAFKPPFPTMHPSERWCMTMVPFSMASRSRIAPCLFSRVDLHS